MNNDSIGSVTILTMIVTHLVKAAGWANENIITIGFWLSAVGSILWMISSYYKSRADKMSAKKSELEIEKYELEIKKIRGNNP